MSYKHFEDWLRGLSSGDDTPGTPTEGDAQIRARHDAIAAQMATFHTDETTLPPGASYRPNGSFYNLFDLADYLQRGGLLILDASGNPQPHPIVHIVRLLDPDTNEVEYETYIDEDTDGTT